MPLNIDFNNAHFAFLRLVMIISIDRNKLDTITRRHYVAATGVEPIQDDLERSNCKQAGEIGHMCCGWDHAHNKPRFMTGNWAPLPRGKYEDTNDSRCEPTKEQDR